MTREEETKARIYKVIQYIEGNLDKKLPLAELAEQASFSAFHFQKVFKSVVGETPKQYVIRLRLEGASHQIVLNPEDSMLKVAFDFGFTSLESFSRAFKNYYQISPDDFRKSSEEEKLEIVQRQVNSKWKLVIDGELFLSTAVVEGAEDLEIEVLRVPLRKMVYIPVTLQDIPTVVDGYKRIKQWAQVRGLMGPGATVVGLMRDFPLFTALEKCRFYTCVTVEEKPEIAGEVHYLELSEKTCARFIVTGGINDLIKTITQFANHWLPGSGYKIVHQPVVLEPFEDPLTIHLHDITYQVDIGIEPK